MHILNALLVTTVHVKMKLGDNALNNERLSLVMTKLPIKKVTNCSPYFKPSFSTDNGQTTILSMFYCVSNPKNFITKYLDNALTHFA